MNLEKALKIVCRFVPKAKDAPKIFRWVQLGQAGDVGFVHATDGQVGVVVYTPQPLPDVVLEPAVIKQINRTGVESLYWDEVNGQSTLIARTSQGLFQVVPHTDDAFPPVPELPQQWQPIPGFEYISAAVHASLLPGGVIRGQPRPDLECLNFLESYVAATDAVRVAVAEVATPIRGLVPGHVFKYWPAKSRVLAGVTDCYAWFSVDGHFRYARLGAHVSWAGGRDMREFVPVWHDGPWIAVDTEALKKAVKAATGAALLGSVALRFRENSMSLASEGEEATFDGEVVGFGQSDAQVKMLVAGKFLEQALKGVKTPKVRVCYDTRAQWLRLESGLYLVGLAYTTG